jgi:hypothetical protein
VITEHEPGCIFALTIIELLISREALLLRNWLIIFTYHIITSFVFNIVRSEEG